MITRADHQPLGKTVNDAGLESLPNLRTTFAGWGPRI